MTPRDPERSKSRFGCSIGSISRKQLKITGQCQWSIYRKSYRGSRMVTWSMTSHDLERSWSWPRYIWALISRNLLEIDCWFLRSTYRKLYMANQMVTWLVTSRDPERSRSWFGCTIGLISRKQLKIVKFKISYRCCQWSTYRKSYRGSRMVTWSMTSHDLERSRSWPRYIWA